MKTTFFAFVLFLMADCALNAQETTNHPALKPARQLEHWHRRHEEKLAIAQKGEIDIVLIGDSITQQGERTPAFAYYFGKRKTLNIGFSGDKTQNVLWRLQHGEIDGLKPKLVVLMIGTNNCGGSKPNEILEGIRSILAEIRQRVPAAKVLLLSIFPRAPGTPFETGKLVNQQLPSLADGLHIEHVDMNNTFLEKNGDMKKGLFVKDLLHLNEKGYRAWYAALEPYTSAAIGEQPLPIMP
jgi:beta-glucosidase